MKNTYLSRSEIDSATDGVENPFFRSITDTLFTPNRRLLILSDTIIVAIAFIVSFWLSPWGKWGVWQDPQKIGTLAYTISFVTVALGLGYYERARRYSIYKIVTLGLLATLVAIPFSLTTSYFFFYSKIGRLNYLWGGLGAYFAVTLVRIALAVLFRKMPYRFTVIGSSTAIDQIVSFASSDSHRESKYYNLIPFASVAKPDGGLDPAKLRDKRVGDIVIARKTLEDPQHLEIAIWALKNRYRVIDDIDFYAGMFERLPLEDISKTWLIHRGIYTRNLANDIFKRSFDIGLSLFGLIAASPFLIGCSLAIKLTSPGPILFIQPRQGQFLRKFDMVKFRTMHQAQSRSDASGGFTAAGDARVTWVGQIMRPLHLDELPQLINILLGHMSFVGPRPEALNFAQDMAGKIDLYEMRYLLKPGLTGHAQLLSGYLMNTVEDTKIKLQFDLYYLCNQTAFLDLVLMARTAFVVLKQTISRRSR